MCDLDEQLEDFYRDRHASFQRSCMSWGFCCGDGWQAQDLKEGVRQRRYGPRYLVTAVKMLW